MGAGDPEGLGVDRLPGHPEDSARPFQGQARVLDGGHGVPAVRRRGPVAVGPPRGIPQRPDQRRHDLGAGADGEEHRAGLQESASQRRRSRIRRAARDRQPGRQPQVFRGRSGQLSSRYRRFTQRRQQASPDLERFDDVVGPAVPLQVVEEGRRGVARLAPGHPAKPQPQPVLGLEGEAGSAVGLRLLALEPEKARTGHPHRRRVAQAVA